MLSPDGVIGSAMSRNILFAAEGLALLFVVVLARRGRLPGGGLTGLVTTILIVVGGYGTGRGLGWVSTAEERGLIARLINQFSDMRGELLGVLLNRPRLTAGGYFKKNYELMASYADGEEGDEDDES